MKKIVMISSLSGALLLLAGCGNMDGWKSPFSNNSGNGAPTTSHANKNGDDDNDPADRLPQSAAQQTYMN